MVARVDLFSVFACGVWRRGFRGHAGTLTMATLYGDFPYLKIEKLANFNFMFLIDMEFTSKILYILFNQSSSFSDPSSHLMIKNEVLAMFIKQN